MHYKSTSKSIIFESDWAKGYQLAETPLNNLVKLEVSEEGAIDSHKLPVAVTFYVIMGEGLLKFDSEEMQAKQGDVIFIEKNVVRSWKNSGKGMLELLVVKQKE